MNSLAPPSWDELRSDTRFAAAGAEPTPLTELWRRAAALPGWFTVDDCGHFALVLGLLAAAPVHGDLLEIGCYHGRSAAVLAHFVADATLILCDQFGSTLPGYGEVPRAEHVEANLRRLHPHLGAQQLVLHVGASSSLALDGRRLRFAHVDGGHDQATALADLRLVARHLVPGGLCAVDDHAHPDFPGVSQAVAQFLAEETTFVPVADLHRHGARGRKLYLRRTSTDG